MIFFLLLVGILLLILGESTLIAIPLGITVEIQFDLRMVGIFFILLSFGGVALFYFVIQKYEEEEKN